MSRKITDRIVGAFQGHYSDKLSNTESTGQALYLHGNKIAEWQDDGLYITNAGWSSNTTKERLNGLRGVSISQKNFEWYLNGKKWDGSWVNVSKWDAGNTDQHYTDLSPKPESNLKAVAFVASLGDIFGKGQKQSNDWKARMLKAELENQGLIMPEDWDTLSEDEKERRLNGAINSLK